MSSNTQLLAVFRELEKRIAAIDIRQGGPQGLRGTTGPKGRKGERGTSGPTGASGAAGKVGTQGPAGKAGTNGAQGSTGARGPSGLDGAAGRHGKDGLHGSHGTDGAAGVGVADATIDFDGHLTLNMTDGTVIDAGYVGTDSDGAIIYNSSGGVPDSLKKSIQEIADDLADHLADFNNPHQVTHAQLPDVGPDDHHAELHDLESHTDVDILGLNAGQGLWWDGTQWINRASFTETWPTGLTNGGELNIGNSTPWNVGDGTRYMTIPPFTIPIGEDFEVELDWLRQDRTGTSFTNISVAAPGDVTSDIRFYDSGATAPDRIAVTVAGSVRVINNALAGIAQGESATIKIARSGNTIEAFVNNVTVGTNVSAANSNAFTTGTLFADINRYVAGSGMHNFSIHNITSGQFVEYKIDEGSGTAILAYDISGTAIPAEDGLSTPDADWQVIASSPNDIEVIAGIGITLDGYTDPALPPMFQVLQWPQINEAITAVPSVAGSIVWFTIYDTGVAGAPINHLTTHVGAVRQYAQSPSPTLQRQEIPLGFAVHDGVTWQEVSNPKVINQTAETLREYITNVQQLTTIIEGGTVSEQALFTLDQAAGTVWENNRNWHVDKSDPNREALPAVSPMVFEYVNRDFTDAGGLVSTVDPTMWDNAGVVEAIGGPANNTTIQRVYLDPANHYWILLGQEIYPNFLTAQANLPANEAVVPFLLQNSILLGYIIAERSQTDWVVDEAIFVSAGASGGSGGGGTPITDHNNLNGIGPDDHHSQTHLLYGPDHTDVNTVVPLATRHVLGWGGEFAPDYRSKFIADYTSGLMYYPQEWVSNNSFISIANTETVEPAFPIEVGVPEFTYPDIPPFVDASNVSQVRSGQRYVFSETGEVRQLRVWIPEVTNDNHYAVVTIKDPDGPTPTVTRIPLDNASLVSDTWNLVKAGSQLQGIGSTTDVYLESQNFGGTTNVTGGWTGAGQNNTAAPAAQSWNYNNANDLIRIDKTDLDTVDRTAELLGIIVGSVIQFVETASPTNSVEYTTLAAPVDQGTYIQYSVSVTGGAGVIPVGVTNTMTADIPVAQATVFVFQTDKWLTDEPTWAAITSLLEYDGVPQAVGDDVGYGIDIEFQQLSQSTEWDLIVLGSSGGGGGGGDFIPSTFTGAGTTGYVPNPISETGRVLKDDGLWSSFVETSGNVGIGITAPLRKLHVTSDEGNVALIETTSDTAAILIANNTSSSAIRANQADLVFYTNGQPSTGLASTERMRIDSAGNVGIGTNAPTTILAVQTPSSAADGLTLQASADTNKQFQILYDGAANVVNLGVELGYNITDIAFRNAGAERMRIAAAGNVGIGNSAPTQGLLCLDRATFAEPFIFIDTNATDVGTIVPLLRASLSNVTAYSTINLIRDTNSTSTGLSFDVMSASVASEAMRINRFSRVGIGSIDPARKLVVEDTTSTYISVRSPNANAVGILFGDADSDTPGWIQYDNPTNSMNFRTNAVERMRIDSAGNVGIGQTAPQAPLHIVGPATQGAASVSLRVRGGNSWGRVDIEGNDQISTGLIFYQANGGASAMRNLAVGSSTGIVQDGAGTITLQQNGVQRLFVATSGLVGINTTSPSATFDVSGNMVVGAQLGGGEGGQIDMRGTGGGNMWAIDVGGTDNFRIFNAGGETAGDFQIGHILANAAGTLTLWTDAVARLTIDEGGVVYGTWNNNGVGNAASVFRQLTQAQYDGLTPDANTIYFIT